MQLSHAQHCCMIQMTNLPGLHIGATRAIFETQRLAEDDELSVGKSFRIYSSETHNDRLH
jgi:hypothetical protein